MTWSLMTLPNGGFTGTVGSKARNRGVGSKWRNKTLALRRYSSLQKLGWGLNEKGMEAVVLEKTLVFRQEILDYLSCYGGGEDGITSRGSMIEVAGEGKLLGDNQDLGTCPEHHLPNMRGRPLLF